MWVAMWDEIIVTAEDGHFVYIGNGQANIPGESGGWLKEQNAT